MLIINKNGIVGKAVEDLRRGSFETPDGETILLRDLLELCELIKSRGEDCNYQVIEDDDGFLLFPMNSEGEVLRYPEEPERKNFNFDDSDANWKRWTPIDPELLKQFSPSITQVDSGTTGNINNDDTLTWKITWEMGGFSLPVKISGGTNDAK